MNNNIASRTWLAFLVLAGVGLACSVGGSGAPGSDALSVVGDPQGPMMGTDGGMPGGMAGGMDGGMGQPLTDGEMIQVLVVANQAQIAQGQLAQTQGTAQGVKDFGGRMVSEHTAAGQRLLSVAQSLGVTPQSSQLSDKLTARSGHFTQFLQGLTGQTFDVAYLDSQAAAHSHLLLFLDLLALPHLQNQGLRGELEALRGAVQQHLVAAAGLIQATPPAPTATR